MGNKRLYMSLLHGLCFFIITNRLFEAYILIFGMEFNLCIVLLCMCMVCGVDDIVFVLFCVLDQ